MLDDNTINIDQQDELGNSALHYAAIASTRHGKSIYEKLIEEGADTTLKNKKARLLVIFSNKITKRAHWKSR